MSNGSIEERRERLNKEKQNLKFEKESWDKLYISDSARLQKEISLLTEIQKNILSNEIKQKELNSRNNLQVSNKLQEIKSEIENLKSLFESKNKEYQQKQKILNDEKENFEKFLIESKNNIEKNKAEIDQKNLNLLQKESELNMRYTNLKSKENYLNEKYNDYIKIKNITDVKENDNSKIESNLKHSALNLEKYMKEIIKNENLILIQKEKIYVDMQKVMQDKKEIEKQKMDIEQEKMELNLRMQYMNNNMNVPNFNYNNEESQKINLPENTNKSKLNNYNFIDYTRNFSKNDKFNADKYLMEVKNRVANNTIRMMENYGYGYNGALDIAKEKEYISKNNDSLLKKKII